MPNDTLETRDLEDDPTVENEPDNKSKSESKCIKELNGRNEDKSKGEGDDSDEAEGPEDGEWFAVGVKQKDLSAGDYEVNDEKGNVTVVRGPPLTDAEEEAHDQKVMDAVLADKRYEYNTAVRTLRFHDIQSRYKQASKDKHQDILDFSDGSEALEKLGTKHSVMVQCKYGNFKQEGRDFKGMPKFHQSGWPTAEEIAEIDATDSGPCTCTLCTARRANRAIISPKV